MKKKIFTLLLCLTATWLQAQLPGILASIPDSLLENADAIILSEENTLKINGTNSATYTYSLRVLNLNANSPFTDFSLYYDKDIFLIDLSLSVLDINGNLVKKYYPKDFDTYSASGGSTIYTDARFYVFDATPPTYPHIIEFKYKIGIKRLLQLPSWDIQPDYRVAVLQSFFQLKYPQSNPAKTYFKNIELTAQEKSTDNTVTRFWAVRNLPAVEREAYAPPARNILPRMFVVSGNFNYKGYNFNMRDWESFSRSMFKLYEGRDKLSEETKATIHRLIEAAPTREEKIAALYRYLQDNTRYVSVQLGIGGYQPFPASYVEKNKYGDCKALTNFMMAMLDEAGIAAQPVLVYRGDRPPELDEEVPRSAFNHVLLYLPEDSTWLECTSGNYPTDYVGSDNANRKALLLDDTNGHLIDMPVVDTALNILEIETETALLPSGKFHIKLHEQRYGMFYELIAYGDRQLDKKTMTRWYRDQSAIPTFTLDNYDQKISTEEARAELKVELTTEHLSTKAGTRELYPLIVGAPFKDVPPRYRERQLPVYYPNGYKKIERGVFHLPSGKKVEVLPESKTFDSPYGRYRLTIEQDESEIRFERELLIYPARLPAEEYKAWRAFLRKVAKADATKVVLIEQ